MSKVTLEVDLEKLTEKGRVALAVLMAEISRAPSAEVKSGTVEQMSDKLYRKMAKSKAMVGLLCALLDKGSLTMTEVYKAAGKEHADGPAIAGVLSSMTRNWQKYGGQGRFMVWDELASVYKLGDEGFLEPLSQARKRFTKSTL